MSPDGLTYTLTLRDGLRYSDGAPVRADDFEHAIKRVLNLESGGSAFYLGIEGAEEYLAAGRARGDIPGITASDRTITIRLAQPDPAFAHVLAMPFASPVPSSTPFENTTRRPPPGSGPFAIRRMRVNRSIVLRRNARFAVPGFARPRRSQVVVRVTRGAGDLNSDARGRGRGRRFRAVPTISSYYFFLNHRVPPFDRKEVRQAVSLAVDRRAVARLFGGQFEPGCNFLGPGLEGYQRIEPCPLAPDVDRARQLVRDAGVAGQRVSVWTNDEDPAKPLGAYLTDVMARIGFRAQTKVVEASVYFTTIGNQRTRAQAGFANWFADFPHPKNFLVLVDPRSIHETNNQNYSNVDDPAMIDHIDAGRWAEADRRVFDESHVVPLGSRRLGLVTSRRVPARCVVWHFQRGFDLTRLC